eukprot:s994_g19.t1
MPRQRLAIACAQLVEGPSHEVPQEVEHADKPERLDACLSGLVQLARQLRILPPRSATDEELMLVHSKSQVTGLKRAQLAAASTEDGLVWLPTKGCLDKPSKADLQRARGLGQDTFLTSTSLDAARRAAGGLFQLVDLSVTTGQQGIALCRPPGHHAGPTSSTGFCLVNNVALAARYALRKYPALIKRVLIFDWDIHHGQGTQEVFWNDSKVLFVSMHLFSKGFYPASGSAQEVGRGRGLGYTVNVAFPEGYTDACLLYACQDVLVPAAERFRPDLMLVSAGFDAMDEDPLGEAKCTADGFARITRLLNGLAQKLCGGRLLLALEGGYDERALSSCLGLVAETLLHGVNDVDTEENFSSYIASCRGEQKPLQASLKAIWETRLAHRTLPLQLLDGCTWSRELVPYNRFRKKQKCWHWKLPRDLSSDSDDDQKKYMINYLTI